MPPWIEWLGFEHDALRGEFAVCLANVIDAQYHPGVLADRRPSRLAAVIGVGRKRGDRPGRRDFDIAVACVTVAADEVFPLLHPEQVAEEMDGFVDVITAAGPGATRSAPHTTKPAPSIAASTSSGSG